MSASARLTLAARVAAVLGLLVCAAAAVWLVIFTTSAQAHWVYPDAYATLLVLTAAAAANGLLFARAGAHRPRAVVGLTFVALCLSVLIVVVFVNAALNLPT